MKTNFNSIFQEYFELENLDHSYNPYLRLSKATKIKLKSYQFNKLQQIIYNKNTFFILFPPYLIIKIIMNSLLNLVTITFYRRIEKKQSTCNSLFFSHQTKRNSNILQDSFYGNLIYQIIHKNHKVNVFYSNQNRMMFKSNDNSNSLSNKLILQKYLSTKQQIQFWCTAIKSVFFSIKKFEQLNANNHALIIKATYKFLNRESMSNFHLIREFKKFVEESEPSSIFLTFEGHIYENAAYIICKNNLKVKNIFMFQSSPWVPAQFGLQIFIENNTEKLFYLVQGKFYEEHLKSIRHDINVLNIGDQHHEFDNKFEKLSRKSTNILFSPDGDKQNIRLYLRFISKYETKLISEKYLSLHPDTKVGFFNLLLISNLVRTKKLTAVIKDLKLNNLRNFDVIIYTSSSLAIKSLMFHLQLFYLNNSEFNINPLYKFEDKSGTNEFSRIKKLIFNHVKGARLIDFKSAPHYDTLFRILRK